MLSKYTNLFVLIVFLTFGGCKTSEKTTAPRNLQGIYNPLSTSLHPEIEVYNNSDTSSLIVEKIYAKELLYNNANNENKLLARVLIKYNLYDLNDKQRLVDSSTTTFKLDKTQKKTYYTFTIDVNTACGNEYLLEVITLDKNRNNSQFSFKRISRNQKKNIQDFILYNKNSDELLTNHFIKNISFGIKHYSETLDSVHVFFFNKSDSVPEPPHIKDTIVNNFTTPDTSWVLYVDSIEYENFNNEGIYYITEEEKPENGFALYNFGIAYPIVKTPQQLYNPLKYLTDIEINLDKDSTGKQTKHAVDNFWLERTNNVDKSRELLNEYYRRVIFSNMYFTSFKEGWQTDRGMIYIIYGLPDYLFKAGDEEKWIYNPTSIGPGISFSFKYYKNPFSLNHYNLERDKIKTTGWDWEEAVKFWNNGEVFYYQN